MLLQQAKTGGGDESSFVLLPASWGEADAPTWQAHTYALFERLHIDKDFAVTSVGTTVFQYMLNAVTYPNPNPNPNPKPNPNPNPNP